MQYCIDYIYYNRNRISCRGWAAPEKRGEEVTVSLIDEKKQTVDASVEYTKRPDVLEYLYHDGSGEEKYGFLITAYCNTNAEISLLAKSGGEHPEELVLDIRQIYRHRNSFVSFLRSKDKKLFLLQKKLGDLQPEDLYYHQWYLKHRVRPSELKKQRKERFSYAPLISVLVPVYNPDMAQFDAMAASVLNQSYPNWQLCLANGSKDNEKLSRRLQELAASDSRIKLETLEENGGISENTNACLRMADGEWCALLDQDDLYEPDALYEFVKAMNAHPDAEILYSDEDKIDDETGAHLTPHFKPDFSPARLHSDNYICHLLMAKTALMRKVGGERSAYDGSQDFDLVLRLTEATSGPVVHISRILYNWRIHAASTSGGMGAKQYAVDAGARAIRDAYKREGFDADIVQSEFSGRYITVPHLKEEPLVSILIPNMDHTEDLRRCVNSLLTVSDYPNIEILIVENNSKKEETFSCYKELEALDPRIRVLYYPDSFNFAKINNFAAREAKGEYLLLLNNDTEVISPDFLRSMLFYAMQKGVGAVGAKLLYDDDTIQHAGVTVGVEGRVIHIYLGTPDDQPGYMGRLVSTLEVSAVTGACLMSKKAVYDEVSGMSEEFTVAYNDVDYCLKLQEKGYRCVYDAYAKLHHYESRSRGYEDTKEKQERLQKEMDLLVSRWHERMKRDPYYNDNLSLTRGFYLLP